MERFYDVTSFARDRFEYGYEWLSYKSTESLGFITSLLFGLSFTFFSWMIIYLDSQKPGVNPPSPFSPNEKFRHRQQTRSSMQLSYFCVIFSGIVATILLWFNY